MKGGNWGDAELRRELRAGFFKFETETENPKIIWENPFTWLTLRRSSHKKTRAFETTQTRAMKCFADWRQGCFGPMTCDPTPNWSNQEMRNAIQPIKFPQDGRAGMWVDVDNRFDPAPPGQNITRSPPNRKIMSSKHKPEN